MKTWIVLRTFFAAGLALVAGCLSGTPVVSRSGSDLAPQAFAKQYASHLKAFYLAFCNVLVFISDRAQTFRWFSDFIRRNEVMEESEITARPPTASPSGNDND